MGVFSYEKKTDNQEVLTPAKVIQKADISNLNQKKLNKKNVQINFDKRVYCLYMTADFDVFCYIRHIVCGNFISNKE